MTKSFQARAGSRGTPQTAVLAMILIGIDFSAPFRRALEWGIELAKRHGAKITLIHALDPAHLGQAGRGGATPAEIQANLAEAAESVRRWQVDAVVEHQMGKPWNVIVEAAARFNCDVIVMGTLGRKTLGRKMLGSTADRVLRLSPAPVLMVHADDDRVGRGFRTIPVPIDFSPESQQAFEMAARLAGDELSKARIVLLHVCELVIPAPSHAFSGADPNYWSELEAAASCDLEKLAEPLRKRGARVETRTACGVVANAVVDAANSIDADLIAMGTQGRTGVSRFMLGSVAERVLEHAGCPVLAVRGRHSGAKATA